MTMPLDLETTLGAFGVVPIVALGRAEDALPLADGLLAGGLPIAEITFRTAAAVDAIALLAERHPELQVGAGTVLSVRQADMAIAAGARFVVAPGFNPAVVDHCLERDVPVLPGVLTPTEIDQVLAREMHVAKLFPAGPIGGVGYLRAIAGPYPMMRFVPTGGVTAENLADYLALPSVVACGGTWLAKPDVLSRGDAAQVERLAREAVTIVHEIRRAQA